MSPTISTERYFVVPLLMCWYVPLSAAGFIMETMAELTDSVPGMHLEIRAGTLISLLLSCIAFVGLCFRQSWALFLMAVYLLIWCGIECYGLCTAEPDPLLGLGWIFWTYHLLTGIVCAVAIYCIKKNTSPPSAMDD